MYSPRFFCTATIGFLLSVLLSLCSLKLRSQTYEYPFQNPNLSEEERVSNLVSLMTLDEKIMVLHGNGIPRLGVESPGSSEAIHGLVRGGTSKYTQVDNLISMQKRMQEAQQTGNIGAANLPQGAQRAFGMRIANSTAFPQAYGLGETWDRAIIEKVGETMSVEARYHSQKTGRNVLCLWAPNADLARDPRWGRTEESFGEDPFLVGELVVAETKGIQGNDPKYWRSAAVYKHFLANSNEDGRTRTSSDFGEDLFRDYYSYGFYRGVKNAGGKSLMCAYNKYNGVPCSTNSFIQDILVDEWGMDGMILNDGGALGQLVTEHKVTDDMLEAVKMSINAGISRLLENRSPEIKECVEKGMISMVTIDRNVKHNLRTMLRLGLLDNSPANPYGKMDFGDIAPWESQGSKDFARLATCKSVVLLKNEDNILPIDTVRVKKIAVVGNRAEEVFKDWYGALPAYSVSPLDGIRKAVEGSDVEVRFQRWDSDGDAAKLAAWADLVIVCVGNDPNTSPQWGDNTVQSPWGAGTIAGEGREALDRRSLQLETEDLIKVVWNANHNTVVALISSFPYAINWTQDHVPAIVHMTQCSQELGNGLADVLFGKYNPAGRTTQTWVKDILDLPNMIDYDITNGRTYMYFQGSALYPFGYGLSYTSFDYSDLSVSHSKGTYKLSFNLTNIGDFDGEEVVQLYVKFAGDSAAQRLRGFDRVHLKKGETKRVEIIVPEEDLTLWDITSHSFKIPAGKASFRIGASSEDIRLVSDIRLR